MMEFLSTLLLLSTSLFPVVVHAHFAESKLPKLLVISFDGFRYDYVDMADVHKKNVSAFRSLMQRGVHANYSKGIFPSLTFPSHTAMVTGLYAEEHGIPSNYFYDPKFKTEFVNARNQTFEDRWWTNGDEPIWITNERQGHHSAVINWVGFSAFYGGRLPTYSNLAYQPGYEFEAFVDRMIPWLEKEHTTLGMLYSNEPDSTGHKFGPDSQEMLDQIERANARLAYVLNKVEQSHELRHSLNIMLISDHGMASLAPNQSINMDELLPKDWYEKYSFFGHALWGLWPAEGKLETIMNKLRDNKNLQVWKKENVPPEFHYSKHRRIAPVIVLANPGWWFTSTTQSYPKAKGDHGYNNSFSQMHPIFMAMGPAFKRGVTVPSVHMIDYYNLMCAVLDLQPSPNNGSLERIQFVLVPEKEDETIVTSTFITYVLVLIFVMLIGGIFSLAALQSSRYHYIHRRSHVPSRMALHDLRRLENGEHTTALLKEGDLDSDDLSDSAAADLSIMR